MKTAMKSIAVLAALAALGAKDAAAQLWYPSFQVPHVVEREFNAAISDAGRTTSLVFQWREGVSQRSQLSLDVGFADTDRRRDSDLALLIGGQYAYQAVPENNQNPLGVLLTMGAFINLDDASVLSVPFGASLGHRFPLEGEMAITPYIHPRFSLDIFSDVGPDDDETDAELNINFDIGASFDINNRFGVRVSATLGDIEAIGFSAFWRPMGLRR